MEEPVAVPAVVHEHHICSHCGYGFDGRCCPQCGMPAGHVRFTFKRLIQNFLDIWGFGSRPMFRTIRDLFYRPGYLIRDYLGGHHLSYFPPFKMLAILTVIIVFLAWVFNLKQPENIKHWKNAGDLSSASNFVFRYLLEFLRYLKDNPLYRILVQNIFVVLAAWIVFRKKGYNLVETAFSQIYINCQFHLITIVWIFLMWALPPSGLLPYLVPAPVAFFVLIVDFKQLYGLTWKKSFWGTIRFVLMTFAIDVIAVLVLFMIILIIEAIAGNLNFA